MSFEYKLVRCERNPKLLFQLNEEAVEEKINSFAVKGWEVVSFTVQREFFGREKNALVLFKKPKL